ncbi:DUF3562 domain-containing protein [Caballeronia sp. SBC2]|jgi:hypothetical protein|uniref:DUF3562 domain-containing protein n=1 Tax=Caballeronia sp. SBC2 TaxID=2705547 RepID=UPI0013E0F428|nr:DUF3562 domain-containing protein [Caballeronia sp. SBC2]QIE29296.1 hypothetical protein SBC2_73720 [Caballeronia sp. SBC2]
MTQRDSNELVQTIAAQTHTPPETVAKMYEDTFREVANGALIQDYVSLFAEKRVRANLRATLPVSNE